MQSPKTLESRKYEKIQNPPPRIGPPPKMQKIPTKYKNGHFWAILEFSRYFLFVFSGATTGWGILHFWGISGIEGFLGSVQPAPYRTANRGTLWEDCLGRPEPLLISFFSHSLAVSGCVAPLHAPSMSYSFFAFLCSITRGQPLLGLGAKPLSCSNAFKCLHKIAGRGAQLVTGIKVRLGWLTAAVFHACPQFPFFFSSFAPFSRIFFEKRCFLDFSKNFDF